MRNRILLTAIILGVWLSLKLIDYLVSGPAILLIMGVVLVLAMMHSVWLLAAQKRKRRLARKENNKDTELTRWQPSVDILVPAKNESKVIASLVHNLFKLDYSDFYVWIIDDCSTDQTPAILEELQKQYPRLKVFRRQIGTRAGKSAALNEVLPLTKGEVIAVFDADAYVAPDFLSLVLPVLAEDGVGAVQAQKKIYEYQKGFLVECQASEYALDTYFQVGRDSIGGAVELRGNGELVKRAALIDVGGWNNNTITDDLDLSMRLLISSWNVRFCPQALVWEEAVTSLKALLRQRRRWAEGSIRRYLDYIFPLNSPRRLSITERIDTAAFAVFFIVPALVFLETTSDVVNIFSGGYLHSTAILLVMAALFIVCQMNFFMAIKHYRKPMPLFHTIAHSIEVNLYVLAHWLPCIFISFYQILFKRQTFTWHRTEHIGDTAGQ